MKRFRAKRYWRAIVAVTIALVLGAGVGVLVEHQRALDKSNAKPIAQTAATTTTTEAPLPDWFGSRASEACPALAWWNGTFGRAVYIMLPQKKPWASKRTALLPLVDVREAAYRSLLPLANADGKKELEFLLTSLGRARGFLRLSSSADGFFDSLKTLDFGRLSRDIGVIYRTAQGCDKT
jgi:hypothetical protein